MKYITNISHEMGYLYWFVTHKSDKRNKTFGRFGWWAWPREVGILRFSKSNPVEEHLSFRQCETWKYSFPRASRIIDNLFERHIYFFHVLLFFFFEKWFLKVYNPKRPLEDFRSEMITFGRLWQQPCGVRPCGPCQPTWIYQFSNKSIIMIFPFIFQAENH